MKKKFNVAIIGLGVGEKHLRAYVKNPSTNVVYAVDKNPLQIKKIKKKFKKIEFLKNSNKVFKNSEIDILSIATYDNSHYTLIMKALDRNMHVFVEKPMCQYSWQLKKIEKKIKEKKLVLYSNLILKKSKLFIDLKKKISQNYFGKIFHIEADYNYGRVHKIKSNAWRAKIPFYSVSQGGGIHLVDLILWLTRKKIKSIFSYANKIVTKNFTFRYPDNVLSILKLDDDTTVKLSIKFGSVNRHHHNLSIYGSKKTFENLITGPIIHTNSKNFPKKISANYKTYKKGDLVDTFIKIIRNKKKYRFEEFKNSLNICFAIDKSYKQGKEIFLK